jgi:hypothetical protein
MEPNIVGTTLLIGVARLLPSKRFKTLVNLAISATPL